MDAPTLIQTPEGVALKGDWTLASLIRYGKAVHESLGKLGQVKQWNLEAVTRLDSAAAVLIWRTWGRSWPQEIVVSDMIRSSLERVAAIPAVPPPATGPGISFVERAGRLTLSSIRNFFGVVELYGQLILDSLFLCRFPKEIPWKEISANVYRAGNQALVVLALVGFLIGLTISYLSSLQLRAFGADLFIINILGLSVIRELGPVLAAILVAGRSGSAMTAQIGVMRVTEEIDALATLGVSRTIRVVLPKVIALTVVMPLLALWTSMAALIGGALAAYWLLDISIYFFFASLPKAVPVANLLIGLAKGATFGFFIALLACHFGLHVRPNTESLSRRTTASVVTAITLVIIVDAVFAIMTRNIGIPG